MSCSVALLIYFLCLVFLRNVSGCGIAGDLLFPQLHIFQPNVEEELLGGLFGLGMGEVKQRTYLFKRFVEIAERQPFDGVQC